MPVPRPVGGAPSSADRARSRSSGRRGSRSPARAARAVRTPRRRHREHDDHERRRAPTPSTSASVDASPARARPCAATPIGNSGDATTAPTNASSAPDDRDRQRRSQPPRAPASAARAPSALKRQLVGVGEGDLARQRDADPHQPGDRSDRRGDEEPDGGDVDRVLRALPLDAQASAPRTPRIRRRCAGPRGDTAGTSAAPRSVRTRSTTRRSSRSRRGSARTNAGVGTTTPPVAPRPPRSSGRRTMPTTRNDTSGPCAGGGSSSFGERLDVGRRVRLERRAGRRPRRPSWSASASPIVSSSTRRRGRRARPSITRGRSTVRPKRSSTCAAMGRNCSVRSRPA